MARRVRRQHRASPIVNPADRPDEEVPEKQVHRNIIFAVITGAILMISIDQTIVATALSSIQSDLDAEISWSSWTITIYSLGQLITMPLAGSIADQFGRKRVFLAAILIFTVASFLCCLAGNIYLLVIFRAAQAIGGGAFIPCATGIVADNFGENRDRAIGLFTSIFPIGAMIGPILGGVVVHYWSWRLIFLINVPIGLLLFIAAWKLIPRSEVKAVVRPDMIGAALLAGTLLLAMLGLTATGSDGVASVRFVSAEVLAIVLAWLFVRRAGRHPATIIPLNLLRGRGFAVMNLLNLLYGAAAFGLGTLVPFYAELRYGIPPIEAGGLLAIRAGGMLLLAGAAVAALRRTGYRIPMLVGLLITSAGLVAISLEPPGGMSVLVWLGVGAGLTGIGMGTTLPAANNASLQLAPLQLSAVAGIRGMFRHGGGMLSVSIASILMTHSADPAITLAVIFLVFGGVIACCSLLVVRVPEHRGAW